MAANTTKTAADPDVKIEQLSKQIDTLRKDVSDLSSLLVEIGVDRKDAALRSGADRMEHIIGSASARLGSLERQLEEARGNARATVAEKPLTSIAIAALVGAAFGYLTASRR